MSLLIGQNHHLDEDISKYIYQWSRPKQASDYTYNNMTIPDHIGIFCQSLLGDKSDIEYNRLLSHPWNPLVMANRNLPINGVVASHKYTGNCGINSYCLYFARNSNHHLYFIFIADINNKIQLRSILLETTASISINQTDRQVYSVDDNWSLALSNSPSDLDINISIIKEEGLNPDEKHRWETLVHILNQNVENYLVRCHLGQSHLMPRQW